MMDYLLLLCVRKMLKCSATHVNICLGALTGALLTCIVVILPIPYAFIKGILFHVFVNTCMLKVGLKIKNIRSFIQAIIMLYIGSFLLGGIMEVFRPYIKVGSLFLLVAIAGYYLFLGIWKFISYMQRWNRYHCDVELQLTGRVYRLKGLIDTGNGLRDPVSGQPVSIIDRKTARKLLQEEDVKNVRYIPYKTIGNREGVLPIIRIDRLCVQGENACTVETPLIGICEEEISTGGEYEMILNPNLF